MDIDETFKAGFQKILAEYPDASPVEAVIMVQISLVFQRTEEITKENAGRHAEVMAKLDEIHKAICAGDGGLSEMRRWEQGEGSPWLKAS